MRRCSKKWLDGDCPDGVLAIFDHGNYLDKYTIIYREPIAEGIAWYLATDANGWYSGHGEMAVHLVAEYRYRQKHRYARWTDLPAAVQRMVIADLT